MTRTMMHAAVVEHFGKPLVLRDVELPTPQAGQVLIKTLTCGVCHTDLHAARADWPLEPKLPIIPGHEGIAINRVFERLQKGDVPSRVVIDFRQS